MLVRLWIRWSCKSQQMTSYKLGELPLASWWNRIGFLWEGASWCKYLILTMRWWSYPRKSDDKALWQGCLFIIQSGANVTFPKRTSWLSYLNHLQSPTLIVFFQSTYHRLKSMYVFIWLLSVSSSLRSETLSVPHYPQKAWDLCCQFMYLLNLRKKKTKKPGTWYEGLNWNLPLRFQCC